MNTSLTRIINCFLPLLMIITTNTIYSMEPPPDTNPLHKLDYKKAFSQAALYHEFDKLMIDQGCTQNVAHCHDDDDESISCGCCSALVSIYTNGCQRLTTKKSVTPQEQFEQACLTNLEKARQAAILKDADKGFTSMVLSLASTYALTKWFVDPKSMGGSFSHFVAAEGTVRHAQQIATSLTALKQPHRHLDDLEREYAVNKCFIPHQLWGKIEKNFEYARKEDDNQARYIAFLEFALHFQTIRPQPPLTINIDAVIDELNTRIDHFLADYAVTPWQLSVLKINIRNFIENIAGHEHHPVRYIYLVGTGGIGKSEFVEQLRTWFEELMPQTIYFNKYVVENSAELQGDAVTKGVLLQTLGEQLRSNRRGSIVLLDDADWFAQEGSIASAAKRVFNSELSTINTAYFSQGTGTADFSLPIPPMLIFFTSNTEISDVHLGSRFDILHFPLNEKDALKKNAFELCEADREYQRSDVHTRILIQKLFVSEIDAEKTIQDTPMKTFRDVKLHVAPLCFYITHTRVTHAHVKHARTTPSHFKID